jgi:hypothetical protein
LNGWNRNGLAKQQPVLFAVHYVSEVLGRTESNHERHQNDFDDSMTGNKPSRPDSSRAARACIPIGRCNDKPDTSYAKFIAPLKLNRSLNPLTIYKGSIG